MIHRLKSSRAGFTLVELIVVIAILAILAGVAIPVYSNYIKKANEAGDLQLLSAVNTAWAAACVGNSINPTAVTGSVTLAGQNGSKTVAGVGAAGPGIDAAKIAALNRDFKAYYGENAEKTFKVYTSLAYDASLGTFAPVTGSRTVQLSNGTTLTVDNAALANLIAGNIIDADPEQREASVNKLTTSMDTLIDKALAADSQDWLYNDEGFNAFLSGLGLTGTLSKEQRANALVLYAASKSDKINVNDIVNAMATGSGLGLDDLMETASDNGALIAKASTAYAMMYAYANSGAEIITEVPGGDTYLRFNKIPESGLTAESSQQDLDSWMQTQIGNGTYPEGTSIEFAYNGTGTKIIGVKISSPPTTSSQAASQWFAEQTSTMTDISSVDDMYQFIRNNEGFQQYVSAYGNADMNAFLGSMQMINDNVKSSNVQSILDGGWTEGGVADWLLQILNSEP